MNSKKLLRSLLVAIGALSITLVACKKNDKPSSSTSSTSDTTSTSTDSTSSTDSTTSTDSTSSGGEQVDTPETYELAYNYNDPTEMAVWTPFPIDDGTLVSEAPTIKEGEAVSDKEEAVGRHIVGIDTTDGTKSNLYNFVIDEDGYLIRATWGLKNSGYGGPGDGWYYNVAAAEYDPFKHPAFVLHEQWAAWPNTAEIDGQEVNAWTLYDEVIPENGFTITTPATSPQFALLWDQLFSEYYGTHGNVVINSTPLSNTNALLEGVVKKEALNKWYFSLDADGLLSVRLRTADETKVYDEEFGDYFQEKETPAINCPKEDAVTVFDSIGTVISEADESKTYTVKGVVTSIHADKNLIIQDETGAIDAYDSTGNFIPAIESTTFKAGDTVIVKGTYDNYNGKHEIVATEALKVVTKAGKLDPATPVVVTSENSDTVFTAANVNAFVKLQKVTLGEINKEGTTTVTGPTGIEYAVYKIHLDETTVKAGDVADITGVIDVYNGNPQLRTDSIADVAKYLKVTLSAGSTKEGDTEFTTTLTGADSYTFGSNVTIKADFVDGYVFIGWFAVTTDAEGNEVVATEPVSTDNEYKFQIAADVHYRAMFESNPMEADSNPVHGEVSVTATDADAGADAIAVWTEGQKLRTASQDDKGTITASWIGNGWRGYIVVDENGKITYLVVMPPNGYGGPAGTSYYVHPDYEDYTTNPSIILLPNFGNYDETTKVHELFEIVVPEGGFGITAHGTALNELINAISKGQIPEYNDGVITQINSRTFAEEDVRVYYNEATNKVVVKGTMYKNLELVNASIVAVNGEAYTPSENPEKDIKVNDVVEIQANNSETFLKWQLNGADIGTKTHSSGKPIIANENMTLTITKETTKIEAVTRTANNENHEYDVAFNVDGYSSTLAVWTDEEYMGTIAPNVLEVPGKSNKLTGEERSFQANLSNYYRWTIAVDSEGYIVYMGWGPNTGYAGPSDAYYESAIKDPEGPYANPIFVLGDDYGPWAPGSDAFTKYDTIIPNGGFVITGHDAVPEVKAILEFLSGTTLESTPIEGAQDAFVRGIAKGALDKYNVTLDGHKVVFTDRSSATFTVTVTGGTTSLPEGTTSAAWGTEVTVTATVEDGKTFVSWNDENGEVVSTNNPYTFTLTKDVNLTAVLEDYVYTEPTPTPQPTSAEVAVVSTNNDDTVLTVWPEETAPAATLDAERHTATHTTFPSYPNDTRFPIGNWRTEVVVDGEGKIAYAAINVVNGGGQPWSDTYYRHPDYADWKTSPAFLFAEGFDKENPADGNNAYEKVIPTGGFYITTYGDNANQLIAALTKGAITEASDNTRGDFNKFTSVSSDVRVTFDAENMKLVVTYAENNVAPTYGNYTIWTEDATNAVASYIDPTRTAVVNDARPNEKYYMNGDLEFNMLFVAIDAEGRIAYLTLGPAKGHGTAYAASYYRNSYYAFDASQEGQAETEGRINPALVFDPEGGFSWGAPQVWQLVVPEGGFVITANRGKAMKDIIDAVFGTEFLQAHASYPNDVYTETGGILDEIATAVNRDDELKGSVSDGIRFTLSEDGKSFTITDESVEPTPTTHALTLDYEETEVQYVDVYDARFNLIEDLTAVETGTNLLIKVTPVDGYTVSKVTHNGSELEFSMGMGYAFTMPAEAATVVIECTSNATTQVTVTIEANPEHVEYFGLMDMDTGMYYETPSVNVDAGKTLVLNLGTKAGFVVTSVTLNGEVLEYDESVYGYVVVVPAEGGTIVINTEAEATEPTPEPLGEVAVSPTQNTDAGADAVSVWTEGEYIKTSESASSWVGGGWRLYVVVDAEGRIAYLVVFPVSGYGSPVETSYYTHPVYTTDYTTNPAFDLSNESQYAVVAPEGGFALVSHGIGTDAILNILTAGEISSFNDTLNATVNSRTLNVDENIRLSYDAENNKVVFTLAEEATEPTPEPVTVTKTIAELATANGWTNATQYETVTLDEVVTLTATGSTNTGKYYTSNTSWRFYSSENATLTITVAEGYELQEVTLTLDGAGTFADVTSETPVTATGSSVVFTANSDKPNLTAVSVTYVKVA